MPATHLQNYQIALLITLIAWAAAFWIRMFRASGNDSSKLLKAAVVWLAGLSTFALIYFVLIAHLA